MKVIVSSRFAVEVVDVLTGDRELIRTAGYESLYYGISWYKDTMFLARRDLYNTKSMIEILDRDLKYVDTVLAEHQILDDVHQILVYDKQLWITSSGDNSIVLADVALLDSVRSCWYPNPKYAGKDVNHFNSLWIDGTRAYAVAHNHGESQLYSFTYPDLYFITVEDLGLGAHNVYGVGDEVSVLSSGEGCVVSNMGNAVDFHANSYPRGLAIGDEYSIVGLSDHCTDRNARHKERRGAIQYYKHDGQFPIGMMHQHTIELWNGMVLEVRGLDFHDLAHNGTVWTGKHGSRYHV